MTATPDIFLSYNREDQARAKLFADAFAAAGFDVWWDTTLRAGEAYDEVTEAALRGAKAVVVLWSPRSVVSRWVRAEATIADRCKTLVPVTIEACERPIMFELTQTADLAHWTGDGADTAWQAFLGDVRRLVVKESAPAVAMPTLAPPTVAETLKPGQSGSAPSLAVLPFTNRSGLPEDEVFAEGMVDDVICALSQGVNVRVLGSTATANLSRAAIMDIAALGRQLGVHYLLEGNIRRVGASLRVTTQLMEAATGAVMWTGKFDRPLAELAELQEELVTDIAGSLDTQVYSQEMQRALKKPNDITAWEAVARSMAAYRNWNADSLQLGMDESARAVAIAPDYAPGLANYAAALADHYVMGPDDPAQVQHIRSLADRALALDPDNAQVLIWVGEALCFIGYPQEGERLTARAVRTAPGSGFLHLVHSSACMLVDRPEQALLHADTAERLMPGSHFMWGAKFNRSRALLALEQWVEASAAADAYLLIDPKNLDGHLQKAFCHVQLEQEADARKSVQTARQLGLEPVGHERYLRRIWAGGAIFEKYITTIWTLYAETEPNA